MSKEHGSLVVRVLLLAMVLSPVAAEHADAQGCNPCILPPVPSSGSVIYVGGLAPGPVLYTSATTGGIVGPLLNDVGVSVAGLGTTLSGGGSGIKPVDGLVQGTGGAVTNLGNSLSAIGSLATIQQIGLAALPVVGPAVGQAITLDNTINPLLSITVLNTQISGSPTGAQLLNASVLSNNLATGAPISASVLAGGKVIALGNSSRIVPLGSLGGSTGLLSSVGLASGNGTVPVVTLVKAVTGVTGAGTTTGTTPGPVAGLLASVTGALKTTLGH